MCRDSLGCCDPAEECSGTDATCGHDVTYTSGDNIVCRPACDDCPTDLPEICAAETGNYDCPSNVFLDGELCIVAGQSMDAGRVSVMGKETTAGGYEVCIVIELGDGWDLDGAESIKAFVESQSPTMVHGQYPLKLGDGISGEDGTYMFDAGCFDVTELVPVIDGAECIGGGSLSIAIKFDVVSETEGGQTAWAMACDGQSCSEPDSDPTTPFCNKPIYVGKKNPKPHQWFKYASWSPCCESSCVETCDTDPTPEPGTTPAPETTPSGTITCTYECTDGTCPDNFLDTCDLTVT